MKFRYFFIMGAALFILFMGCEKENAISQDNISPPKSVVEFSSHQSKGNPSAFIPENSYEFAPVVDGTQVIHDFIVLNKGDGDLEIQRVKTG
ncbi:MAG: hypothetical protein JRJ27_18490 [Deltaproteobacteria bacterium]|nr:hypothetical protein [Deltaproteobacteria bacterium]MBW2364162.1 hypothetical protein [Deltaproteobacteria bacterium]